MTLDERLKIGCRVGVASHFGFHVLPPAATRSRIAA
jgi:hypothetical protein